MSLFRKVAVVSLLAAALPYSAAQAAGINPAWTTPTTCIEEAAIWSDSPDVDVQLKPDASLFVMFHGNRFVAARALVAAFEAANPGVQVGYSAIPPLNTLHKLYEDPGKPVDADKPLPIGVSRSIVAAPRPDVVLLTMTQLAVPTVRDQVAEPVLYSRLRGLVFMARADDARVASLDSRNAAGLRWVFPAGQALQRLFYQIPIQAFGSDTVASWINRPDTSFSDLRHHRSVPARIMTGCADVGFQYAQSQPYLEEAYPGKFKFFDVPAVSAQLMAEEDSYVAVVNDSPRKALAQQFKQFMLGPEAQAILARYKLDNQSDR